MNPLAPRVTVLGGGNGISAVLEGLAGLKRSGTALEITAVVATSDDGGSSGRIREHRGGLPPGDLRRCLLALAGNQGDGLQDLFAHRYDGEGELAGHVLGNLMLSALADRHGCFLRAVERAERLLDTCGRVLPVSLDSVHLRGVTRDGRDLTGESSIGRTPSAIERVELLPAVIEPTPGVLEAIRDADLAVVGPGSLFTSLLPVLLVPGVADALRHARGATVLVANLMTQAGETLDMDLTDHLEALDAHVGPGLVRELLVNNAVIAPDRLRAYEAHRSEPVSLGSVSDRPERLRKLPLATESGKIRHDAERLATALLTGIDKAEVRRGGGAESGRISAACSGPRQLADPWSRFEGKH